MKQRIIIFGLAAMLAAACGCTLFGSEPEDKPDPEPVVENGQQQPDEPEPDVEIIKPEIPQPDEATAKAIADAIARYTDEELKPGERQDALLKDLAAMGTIAYADVLRLVGDPEASPRHLPEVYKYFHSQPDAAARDGALVVQLFNDDEVVRAGAWRILTMLHPKLKAAAYEPDASEQRRYKAICEIKKSLGQ